MDFEYDYQILTYNGDTTSNENLRRTEYYNADGKIIRSIGRDQGCMRFIYDSIGHLIETIWGRNCNYGVRELMIYDSSYNLLGSFRTRDSLVNLDTVKYKQTKFYGTRNNLIKELNHEWNDLKGERHEEWNLYVYEGDKRIKEIDLQDGTGLVWTGTYEYDSAGNLKAIKKIRNQIFKTETFKYDSNRRLIERELKSNEYPLTPDVSHSASNNKTLYKYNGIGQLVEEVALNHKGKVYSRVFCLRKSKSTAVE
ncbi:MAG TPA: hypothetical protein VGQ59_19640 [Cyclobacteriaceae bacterium]|nr:hypothetical protein [Cyclobacteriaceae bacterium]